MNDASAQPTPHRILMTADPIGGVFSYALDLARELGEHQVEVLLVTMGAGLTSEQQRAVVECRNVRLFERTFALEWMQDPWDDLRRAGELLLELEARSQPDCVHINGFVHAALPFRAPTLCVGHSCVLSWWQAVHGTPPPERWHRYKDEVTRGLQAAELVVAPSGSMLSALEEHYGVLRRARVIPNGHPQQAQQVSGKRACILAAGRLWDEAKNLAPLMQLAQTLPWPVWVAGDRRGIDGSLVDTHGAHWLGQLSSRQLTRAMADAAIFTAPALYEPFGLAVLEAAANGCALVLADIPSLRENWSGAACFVAPKSPHELEAALRSLIADDAAREKLGETARLRARAFTSDAMARGYLHAYGELLRDRLRRTSEGTVCA